jgi:hypothetical protein
VKFKRNQALLRSNLSAIDFMDILHFGKGFLSLPFIYAGITFGLENLTIKL